MGTESAQIAIPNVSKYLLNGHKSTQQAIQTLYQSVQLNINNPNFLIMQGRITKVRATPGTKHLCRRVAPHEIPNPVAAGSQHATS